MKNKILISCLAFILFFPAVNFAQLESFKLDDTTGFLKDLSVIRNKYHSLSFSGYLQVQYQYADTSGIQTYNGGNFSAACNNRFMIRRGRFRMDYERKTETGFTKYYFGLQFDGSERGVNIRDMFGRIYENKFHDFVVTIGMFNRPFGNELNYSSVLRESPERGRMSQILMNTERDLGAMISFEPQDKKSKWYPLKIDAGVFNGEGLTGPAEYDKFKDFISRISLRKTEIAKKIFLSGGISYLNGGFRNGSKYNYSATDNGMGEMLMLPDTSIKNIEMKAPRIYHGADMQLSFDNPLGKTEIRGEYVFGTQSATYATSVTPGIPPLNKTGKADSVFTRNFNGAYFYLLHTFLKKHEIFLKYDWYDPNTKVSGSHINPSQSFGAADVRYNTFGCGYILYLNENVKFVFYFEHPMNEKTSHISGYGADRKDNTYTCRVQFRF
jgi:hypothetical protein